MARKLIRPLRNENDYEAALDDIERYFDHAPKLGTRDADRFDLLALVIDDYEKKHWPIDPPDSVDAIRYRMETGGFSQADLGRLLGSRQRASDILARKRRLTKRMAWTLHREWDIPAEALIRPRSVRASRVRRVAAE
jgi:HTH-type transcriptional regulator/antitoxin HigA